MWCANKTHIINIISKINNKHSDPKIKYFNSFIFIEQKYHTRDVEMLTTAHCRISFYYAYDYKS